MIIYGVQSLTSLGTVYRGLGNANTRCPSLIKCSSVIIDILCASRHVIVCLLWVAKKLGNFSICCIKWLMILFDGMFPYYTSGKIVAGFGRGSAHLGFPTGRTKLDKLWFLEMWLTIVETFRCIADTVEDSSSVRSYRIVWKVKFLLQIGEISKLMTYNTYELPRVQ